MTFFSFIENDSTTFFSRWSMIFLRTISNQSFQFLKRFVSRRWQSSSSYDSKDNDLIPPTTCCMSNCVNCKWNIFVLIYFYFFISYTGVWFSFAEEIAQRYPDASIEVIDDVLKKYIDDKSFREFLEFEIKIRSIGKN